jgi:dTDP-4-amino-4,6-dideoxygalactose transaminase/O-antigen/teichoic acid export membrane protein
MLDLTAETLYQYKDIEKNIDNVIKKSNFILGAQVKELEQKVASYIGTKYAVGCSSGTDALVLSLRALAIKNKMQEYWDKEDLIITTPFTFTATGDSILRSGAIPLFVDIDLDTYNINPELVEKAIKKYGKRIKGIVPVHLYGQPCNMDEIVRIAKENNLFIVEDCAQSFGAKWDGKCTGSFGDTGCFSFFPSKNLGGFGDGGMITTNDEKLYELISMLIKHGGIDKYNVEHIGYNVRLDTLQAAILLAKMEYIDEFTERRRKIAKFYNDNLQNIEWIITPKVLDRAYHVYHQHTIRRKDKNREEIQKTLLNKGIQTIVYYPVPLHKIKIFINNRMEIFGDLKDSETASKSVLSLPIEPLYGEEEIKKVIKSFVKMTNRLKLKSEFARNVLTLMTGTTIAQAISMAISPIIRRLYTPEDFGVVALFAAITYIFESIANGRYELAIMLPKKDEDAINIFALGFIINVVISLSLLIIILIFHDYILMILNNKEISPWLYFVPFIVFLSGIFNLLYYFNNRMKQYKDLTKANVYKSIAGAIVQLSLGFIKAGALGLISGQIISQVVSILALIKTKINVKSISIEKIKFLFFKYSSHLKFLTPTAILDSFSLRIPVFAISLITKDLNLVGQYSLVERILSLPLALIGSSVGQVFYQEFSSTLHTKNKYEAKKILFTTWKKLFIIGILPTLIILFFGDKLFMFIFGSKWEEAGKIAQILSIMFLFMFISSPTSSAYIVLGMQRLSLVFGIVTVISRGLMFLFLMFLNFYTSLLLYVFLELFVIAIYNILLVLKINIWRSN